MTTQIQEQYGAYPQFWNKQLPKLVGDLEQRPSAVEMLGDVSGKLILEAGCGTGYVARMIARKGARVIGIDNCPKVLRIAKEHEEEYNQGIHYSYGDVTDLAEFERGYFDAIASVGVVHHLSTDDYKRFLQQAKRVLKPESPLVISLAHPSLFYPNSPARDDEPCWFKVSPLEDDKTYDESQEFYGELHDMNGNRFDSTYWYHPIGFLFNQLSNMGFSIQEVREPIFRKKHRHTPFWGDTFGYPTHLMIRAVSGGELR